MKIFLVTIQGRFAQLERYYKRLDKYFTYTKPSAKFSRLYRTWTTDEETGKRRRLWDGKVRLFRKNGVVPAGLLYALEEDLKKDGYRFVVEDIDVKPVTFKHSKVTSDRKAQRRCVKKMQIASNFGGGLVISATGTGKTYVAGMYFSRLEGEGVFIVNELTLLKQARKELSKVLGEKVGIVGKGEFKPRRITVATIQTMHRHRKNPDFKLWTKDLDVIFIDELHEALNKSNFQTVESIRPPVVFGLTATLALKKKHVRLRAYSLCGPVIYEYPLKKGQDEGYLDDGVAIQVPHAHYFEKGKGMRAWVYEYTELVSQCKDRQRLVVKLVKEGLKRKKHIVILVERVKHLKDLSKRLKKKRIPHALAFGEIDSKVRFDTTEDFDKGLVKVIIANRVFQKGINLKRLNVIIDAAAMKSQENALQKFGRGVRKHEEKKGLIYFDIADLGNRFEENAKRRKRALTSAKIPVVVWKGPFNPKDIYDHAEKLLAKRRKKNDKERIS